ncbi:MAG: transporter [Citricoccus sp.]|nr:transporter [Citricoccus sp. WCRC_4]
MITAVLLWAVLQGVGWALIYYPHVPGGFMHSSGVDPADYPDFVEALYVFFMTLSTLGFGDVVPTDPGIRVAAPLQALTGFALLTAALTWFMQIYPPMSRRRSLALELKLLADTDYAQMIGQFDATTASRTLNVLAEELGKVRIDFTQHSEGFYFREQDPDLSLARQLPHAVKLRDAGAAAPASGVRLSAQRLSEALEQLAQKLETDFVHTGDGIEEIFAAYAEEHGQSQAA